MKYILFILVVACTTMNISAQDIVKVFFKSQSQIKDAGKENPESNTDSIPYIIVDPSGNIINTPPEIKIDTVSLLSLEQHMFVLKQDYCLYDKRKKKFYGYNDNEQFGTTYSFGIKCNGFNIITDQAVQPWKYDEHYNEFKSNKLEPLITSSKYLMLNSETYGYVVSDSIVSSVQTVKDNYFYTSESFTSSQYGLDLNVADTCRVGILVWILKKSGEYETGDLKIDFDFVPTKIEMFGSVVIKPSHCGKEILGCLLVTRNNDNDKKWYLSGLADCKEDTWTLYYPFKGFKFNAHKQNTPAVKGRLTEIKPTNNK